VNKELVLQYIEKEKRAENLILANKELLFQNKEKEKRAEELIITNKELSAFTYIASHDLQEPLRKTQLFISRILENKEEPLSEKNMDYFKRIQASANRMQVLINDILDYSRVTETSEKFKNIDLNSIVENVLQELTLAETIAEKNATIHYGTLPHIQ
ncbi:sensor histidine kinase, partial [Escherichia coli]|uniref:sensor histidine kinase n=1 Tax=Escherichia coli TaxID=562 RepID=UPI00139DB64F